MVEILQFIIYLVIFLLVLLFYKNLFADIKIIDILNYLYLREFFQIFFKKSDRVLEILQNNFTKLKKQIIINLRRVQFAIHPQKLEMNFLIITSCVVRNLKERRSRVSLLCNLYFQYIFSNLTNELYIEMRIIHDVKKKGLVLWINLMADGGFS